MTVAEENSQALAALAKVDTPVAGLDVQTLGRVLVQSGYFQDTKQISQAIVKVLAGQEIGLGPIAAMQGVYLVKGRVTYSANVIAASIQRSGRYRYRVDQLDRSGCTLQFYERWSGGKWEPVGKSSFTADDAKQAGLGGTSYSQFPRNMYFARALTNGARWYCPDVFNGVVVYTPDEFGATVDDDGEVIEVPAAPPMSQAEVKANAQKYVEIHGDDGSTERVQALLIQNAKLQQHAADMHIPGLRQFNAQSSWSVEQIEAANAEVAERIRERDAELDAQAAREAGQVTLLG
jgi:fructose-specific phosphotransferase system component IIB